MSNILLPQLGSISTGFSFSGGYSDHTNITLQSSAYAIANSGAPYVQASAAVFQKGPAYIPFNISPGAVARSTLTYEFEIIPKPGYGGPPASSVGIMFNADLEADTDSQATSASAFISVGSFYKEIAAQNGQHVPFPLTTALIVATNSKYDVTLKVGAEASGTADDGTVNHYAFAEVDPTITLDPIYSSDYEVVLSPEITSATPEPSTAVLLSSAFIFALILHRYFGLSALTCKPCSRTA